MVATSEAHDSGLCEADRATEARFARDLRNLTLASPQVNRHEKTGKDAGEWLPARNRCWFAARVVEVNRAYRLTVDRREWGFRRNPITDSGANWTAIPAGNRSLFRFAPERYKGSEVRS